MSFSKPLKSTFTFKLVRGDEFKWEIECFFFNHKEKHLEPISSSSQTVARELKVPFGYIEAVKCIDSNLLCISNKTSDRLVLQLDRLSPFLDDEDGKLKRALLHFKPIGCVEVVKMLNRLIKEFHSDDLKEDANDVESSSSLSPIISTNKRKAQTLSDSGYKTSKNSVLKRTRSLIIETQSISLLDETVEMCEERRENVYEQDTNANRTNMPSSVSALSEDGVVYNMKNSNSGLNVSNRSDEDLFRSVSDVSDRAGVGYQEKNTEGELSVSSRSDDETTMTERIKMIIDHAEIMAIPFEQIAVPEGVLVNNGKVSQLQQHLFKTPDKTKSSLIGLIRVVDENEHTIGKFQCWVNCELFVAWFRLKKEGKTNNDRILSVVHSVLDGDSNMLGNFLLANSKDFDTRFADKMLYQDLLRFSIGIIREDNAQYSRKFLRDSLKCFTKGYRNSTLLEQLALLPDVYLKNLEKFIDLYETGSLKGIVLSSRKRRGLGSDDKTSRSLKTEVPLDILKNLIIVDNVERDFLLSSVVDGSITYTEFQKKLEVSSGLKRVKDVVSTVTEKSFQELKKTYPSQLDDESLLEFIGAKSHHSSGPNPQHSKLTQYVKDLTGVPTNHAIDSLTGGLTFLEVETLSLVDKGRKIKESDVIFIESYEDGIMLEKFGYVIREHVLSNKGLAVYAVSESKVVDLCLDFTENVDIVVERIYVKSKKMQNDSGIVKEIVPMLIAGHSKFITGCGISNIIFEPLDQAVPKVLNMLVKLKMTVTSIFSGDIGAFDIDPKCLLLKKGVSVNYVGPREKLNMFKQKVTK